MAANQRKKASAADRSNTEHQAYSIAAIIPNPDNPRNIKPARFAKLVQSIKDFPKMMELRPIIIDSENVILGGNMRYEALKELGYKTLPHNWVRQVGSLSDEEKRRFLIADNTQFGEWDYDILANLFDKDELLKAGFDPQQLGDILSGIDDELEAAKKDNHTIEAMELQPEEHYDYVVLLFRKRVDFARAITTFGLKRIDSSTSKLTTKIGIGRCIDGNKLFAILDHKQGQTKRAKNG
jgi:hypothetical protein